MPIVNNNSNDVDMDTGKNTGKQGYCLQNYGLDINGHAWVQKEAEDSTVAVDFTAIEV
jgi:hypothetical protein